MLIITLLHRWRLWDPKFKARLNFETLSQNTKVKGCSSVEEYRPTICEPWNSIPSTAKQNDKDGAPITLLLQYKDRLSHSELLSAWSREAFFKITQTDSCVHNSSTVVHCPSLLCDGNNWIAIFSHEWQGSRFTPVSPQTCKQCGLLRCHNGYSVIRQQDFFSSTIILYNNHYNMQSIIGPNVIIQYMATFLSLPGL